MSTQIRGKPKYDVNFWNINRRMADDLPKTTNGVESWHNAFGTTLRSHPTVKNENQIREVFICCFVKFRTKEQNKFKINSVNAEWCNIKSCIAGKICDLITVFYEKLTLKSFRSLH
ncbi:hypothetical protein BpHYR1_039057 [Brachionus plicatilis]|uniref:MULE transposase domain-containing protein n=1 Tax=Brachionus plicatilis TaxID=10195 RepID=A0A3M7S340_BRAPC|nr:hypothetical protein BpHYR1_039057 [Brachionus plicatilis]